MIEETAVAVDAKQLRLTGRMDAASKLNVNESWTMTRIIPRTTGKQLKST